ncbi:tRNA pseudouridine(13) synthase TruD [Aquisalimonas sp.]|uniref:tRNA pseudouridine(13) synthase TruD n=1 Tax=Aquisalimonas sp. TaxID=1872621 RepID=UPI0025C62B8C|nr:tRNA pseudouridine(13) synthase TruD [Aquisalimonas sp.]
MTEGAPDLLTAWEGLPFAYGRPPIAAAVRQQPEDFRVMEDLGVAPDGAGEHIWVHVRKTGWNTADVGQWLARALGRSPRDVTWAGLKDRHAVAEQWFGVHRPGGGGIPELPTPPEGIAILATQRHGRKLRTGMLQGNRFRLTLREVEGPLEELGGRLLRIAHRGVPNYFGGQRFGHGGGNLSGAWRLLDGMPVRNRQRRGLFLSAARAFMFNQVLAARVRPGLWDAVIAGDLMTFTSSASLFPAAELAPGDARVPAADVHPSGPLPGRGGWQPEADAGALEAETLAPWQAQQQALARLGVDAARRALRLPVRELAWDWPAHGVLRIGFWLPAGAFATAVLRECCTQRERALSNT